MEQELIVVKFGGTSVGSPEAIRRSIGIVAKTRKDWPAQVVVLSAMSGVTDKLLESAFDARQGNQETFTRVARELRERHQAAVGHLVSPAVLDREMVEINQLIDEFESICHAIAVFREATPRALDAVASFGERMVIRVFSAALAEQGVPAAAVESTNLIVTDESFQGAHPDYEASRTITDLNLQPVLEGGIVPIVSGFIGATKDGVITTLGRGGSDFSAAILGTILDAQEVWIWTDVDGVMTADPRLVPDAVSIPELSYLEMSELAYFGAKVLHPRTVRPVVEAGIPLRIRNSFQFDHPGTKILIDTKKPRRGSIQAVTAIARQGLITIEGRGMLGVPGAAARAFGAVADTDTSVILITQASSEQSICFSVDTYATRRVIKSLEATFETELANRDIDRIWVMEPVVIITVVGAGLRDTPGIAGQIFNALGQSGVNVIAIAQGSSEVAISILVKEDEAERGVRVLHELILNSEGIA